MRFARLRCCWSGCTTNAAGFADVFGDDIAIRIAMVEDPQSWAEPLKGPTRAIVAKPLSGPSTRGFSSGSSLVG
jgi:hypothetical protein